ncbi:MAG TPA: tetratricopeptide repeat protein [Acidobacteriaceae bacterium]|nr:tetratricopeptide repeat protein [Acidobacteriaceae bacterium]
MGAAFLTLVWLLPALAQGPSASPDQLLTRAIDEQQKGDLASAIRDYRAYLTERPNTLAARVNLGAALAHTGQLDAAIAEYEAALKLEPQQPSVHLDLGLAFSRKGDLNDARAEFDAAHRANPHDSRIAILLGDAEARTGRAADAVAMLTPMETENAGNSDFEYVLGEALIAAGHPRDGAQRVEKSAAMSNSAESWMLAGSTLLDVNEFQEARRDLDNAMKLNPALPGLCTLDGTARDKDGDANAAEPAFRRALQQNPDDFEANLYLGAILLNQRSMDEAKIYLHKAMQLNPASTMARYETAMWLSTSGQYQDAAQILEKLTVDAPKWLEPHVELASLYYKLHRPEDGKRERAIVDQLTAEQQQQGPGK